MARSWHDPSNTDPEHALCGVMITTTDELVNSPELAALGGYIVFESAEIAYDQLIRQMDGLQASMMSTSVAGAKVWIINEEDVQLGVMRLANVFIMAYIPNHSVEVMEGIAMHLDTVTRAMV
jgi:hypothetical protein